MHVDKNYIIRKLLRIRNMKGGVHTTKNTLRIITILLICRSYNYVQYIYKTWQYVLQHQVATKNLQEST